MIGKQCRPDQMPQNVASDLGLHCLLRPVCQNTFYKYIKCLFLQITLEFLLTEPYVDERDLKLCVFGQKCLRVIHYDQNSYEVQVNTDLVLFDDWIWDVAWLQVDTLN